MENLLGQDRSRQIPVARGGVGLFGLLIVIGATGCPGANVIPPPPDGGIVDGNRDTSVTSPIGKTSGEPNDDFSEPVVVVFNEDDVARLQGTVEVIGDLDVFYLGSLTSGDRVTVDAYATDEVLDVSIALFDADQRLVANNDDREDDEGQFLSLDSLVDVIVRHSGDPYYLVVSHAAFADPDDRVGTYRVDINVESGVDVPQPVSQTLVLDFDGGDVNLPRVDVMMTLGPFDAADISAEYEGETETIKNRIREVFEENYERFNIAILTTDDPPPAAGTPFSTVFFGGFEDGAFGIAGNIDLYNVDRCDDAIIFTESFTPSMFTNVLSAEEMGTAIGNVGSHESGHILGLVHTDDDRDLMDDRSPADVFLDDQEFMEAPLSQDIVPIGTQDGVLLLNESIGPRP